MPQRNEESVRTGRNYIPFLRGGWFNVDFILGCRAHWVSPFPLSHIVILPDRNPFPLLASSADTHLEPDTDNLGTFLWQLAVNLVSTYRKRGEMSQKISSSLNNIFKRTFIFNLWSPPLPSCIQNRSSRFARPSHSWLQYMIHFFVLSVVNGNIHRKKSFSIFQSPAGMSLSKLSLGGNTLYMTSLFPPRESLVSDIPAGDGNIEKIFLRCTLDKRQNTIYYTISTFTNIFSLLLARREGGEGGTRKPVNYISCFFYRKC